ncbi:MAG: HAMP domain-containing protein [Candidatus Aenigmarchaeota archaeon]|nr:HAMP domain-containing protein [Candidatus Aenigmarchaeota archaeon]
MPVQNEVKKMRKFRSLTVTLAIAFFALSSVALSIASSLQIYFSFQTQKEMIASEQQLIAQNAANEVKSFIEGEFAMLKSAASIGGLITANKEEQRLVLEKLLGLEPSFRQLLLLNAEGQELSTVSRLSALLSHPLTELNKSELLSQMSQGETYISSVYIDEITSEPMVTIAVPVTDVFGDFKGALMAEVNLIFMWDLVAGLKVGKKGTAYVVDKQGNLIAFNDISRVLKGENLIHLKEVNEFVRGDEFAHISSADISKGIKDAQVVASCTHLGKPDWAVVVELPVEEAYETVTLGIELTIFTVLISFLLAILAGIYISKRITKPVIILRDAAINIGKGGLDTRIEIKTKNEIGELASAFNRMTNDLKKSKAELEKYSATLEKKVEERTKELEGKNEELERFNKLAVGRELKMIELKKIIKELEGKLKKK